MALLTYQDLLDAVSGWLNREDAKVTNRIPDFIVMGENRIFRKLRTRVNEEFVLFDALSGDNTLGINLPSDYKEAKFVRYNTKPLTRKTDQYLLSRSENTAGGQPIYFARILNTLQFWRPPDQNADVELWYWNQQPHISAQVTPDLYVQTPEIYVWAALLEAKPFLKTKDALAQIPIWQGKYDEVFEALQLESEEEDESGSTNDVSNIYTDDLRTTDGKNVFIR